MSCVCRICTVPWKEDDTRDIQDPNPDLKGCSAISVILRLVPEIEMHTDQAGSLTQRICLLCLEKLASVCELRNQIIESHERLEVQQLQFSSFPDNITIEVIETADATPPVEGGDSDDGSEDAASFLISSLQMSGNVSETPTGPHKQKTRQRTRRRDSVPYDQRKFQCQFCDKRFLQKSNLDDHIRLHRNQKPFECEFCKKAFSQVANYRTHLRVHTAEKPFVCYLCNKAYSQPSSLTIHLRSHTNERNYPCAICGKRFTNSSDMKKHWRRHDPGHKMNCPVEMCEKKFAQKVNLKLHLAKIHPGIGSNP